jgi:hypothetical protein
MIVRILLALASVATLFVTALFVSSPSGTTIDPSGAIVDLIAVIVLALIAWSIWRDRRALF